MPETTPAGATPVVAGATPAQTSPAPATAASQTTPDTSATDYPDGMGDAGKQALDRMKASARDAEARAKAEKTRADAAQTELDTFRTSTLSESEKARKEEVNAATAAERAKWQTSIREVRVEAALRVAGASNERLLELALRSDVIAALKVDDHGKVIDLDKAVAQLKTDIPEMFASSGAPTRGAQPGPSPAEPKDLEAAVAAHYAKH
jgi:hypothetical protein